LTIFKKKISYNSNRRYKEVNGKEQPIIEIGLFHFNESYIPIWIVPLNSEIVLSNNSPEVPKIKISWLNIYNN